MSEWISANELPPVEGRKYLVYFPDGTKRGDMWVCDGYTYGRPGDKKRGIWNVPDGLGGYDEIAPSDEPMAGTFYMELPNVPDEKRYLDEKDNQFISEKLRR